MLSTPTACSLRNQLPRANPRRQPHGAISKPSPWELSEPPGPLPCPPSLPLTFGSNGSCCLCGQTDPERGKRVPERGRGSKSSPLNWHSELKPTLGYGLALVTRDNSWAYSSAFELLGLGPVPPEDTAPRHKADTSQLGQTSVPV